MSTIRDAGNCNRVNCTTFRALRIAPDPLPPGCDVTCLGIASDPSLVIPGNTVVVFQVSIAADLAVDRSGTNGSTGGTALNQSLMTAKGSPASTVFWYAGFTPSDVSGADWGMDFNLYVNGTAYPYRFRKGTGE